MALSLWVRTAYLLAVTLRSIVLHSTGCHPSRHPISLGLVLSSNLQQIFCGRQIFRYVCVWLSSVGVCIDCALRILSINDDIFVCFVCDRSDCILPGRAGWRPFVAHFRQLADKTLDDHWHPRFHFETEPSSCRRCGDTNQWRKNAHHFRGLYNNVGGNSPCP